MSKARNLSDFISDPTISSTEIADQAVTHAKLHTTMDLSSKTVTLPTLSTLNTTGNVGIGATSLGAGRGLTVANGAVAVTSANLSHSTSSLVLGQDSASISQIRFYGANTSTAGILEFTGSSSDGTVGGERMRIDASGNVGIGTTSPSVNLEVSDSGNSFILVKNTSSGSGLYIKADTDGDAEIQTAGGNNNLVMRTSGQERMRIDSSGNVGLNLASPSEQLSTLGNVNIGNNDSSNPLSYLRFGATQYGAADIRPSDEGAHKVGLDFYTDGTGDVTINPTFAMRITGSGNLLVGKTSDSLTPNGAAFFTSGQSDYSSDAAYISKFNKKGADGTILEFRKDTTTVVGNIGVESSDNLTIGGTVANHSGLLFGTNTIIPMQAGSGSDATQDLGNSGSRFKDAYLSGGVYLGGTGSANKLDDYEEGTWTPAVASATNTPTFHNNVGRYTKIGRVVTLQFFQQTFLAPTFSSDTDVFYITGLPFSVSGSGYTGSQGSMNAQGFQFNGDKNNQNITGQVSPSVVNAGGVALNFQVTNSGGTRGQVNHRGAKQGYIIEATVTYFTTQ